ncbi:MAG: hypothetical protein DRI95_08420 [Bacteroidetes bacterium]|nr:MAG: hypothetical protein DRI95_08420 [Bacteroidota bacterium]RLD80526.1 MAG: hypothetical protein DRJ07_10350 [Bacteroidota bacterium]
MENLDEQNVDNTTGGDSANDDKVIGILSYLGILWVIAYILYGKKKSEYNIFHLRQGLGLFIIWIGLWIVGYIMAYIPLIGGLIMLVLYLGVLVLMIMGIIGAANGEKKELPVLGKLINENLKGFN